MGTPTSDSILAEEACPTPGDPLSIVDFRPDQSWDTRGQSQRSQGSRCWRWWVKVWERVGPSRRPSSCIPLTGINPLSQAKESMMPFAGYTNRGHLPHHPSPQPHSPSLDVGTKSLQGGMFFSLYPPYPPPPPFIGCLPENGEPEAGRHEASQRLAVTRAESFVYLLSTNCMPGPAWGSGDPDKSFSVEFNAQMFWSLGGFISWGHKKKKKMSPLWLSGIHEDTDPIPGLSGLRI